MYSLLHSASQMNALLNAPDEQTALQQCHEFVHLQMSETKYRYAIGT